MNKIMKIGAGAAAVTAVAAGALVISAWGPTDRETYTMEVPADKVTFNSITNNPMGPYTANGDERYFVEASEFTGDASQNLWRDETTVENGKEYVVHMYVHNDAASNLNLVAENVHASVLLPTDSASSITVSGLISSSNATPNKVWDETTFVSADGRDFTLDYVEGSAKFTNCDEETRDADKACTASRTFALGNELFTQDGAALGYNQMDGNIPGCIAYAGWVSFHVKANFHEEPNYEVSKDAKIKGSDQDWSKSVEGAKDGDVIVYRLHFANTGNTTLYDVNLRDLLPIDSLNFQEGTTYLVNAEHTDGLLIEDTIATEGGVFIGDYAPGADAYVFFETTVKEGVDDECQNTQIHNKVQANASTTPDGKTRGDSKEDTADVYVEGQICEDEKHPGFTIDKMVQIKGTDSWSETVKAKAGETVRYRIQFKNTGETTLENVVIRDTLPAGLNYVAGSTVLYNSANTEGKTMGDEVVNGGLNIGSVEAGSEATIYFYATVDNSFADDCEESKLTNIVRGKYNNDDNTEKEDTADVTVEAQVCDVPDVPEYPKTGAENKLGAIVAAAILATATAGYITSRKK